jgi:hypothetical protein
MTAARGNNGQPTRLQGGEEKLKNEFSGVKRSYIPLQAIIRIDEVDKEGSSKISDASPGDSNVASFPFAGINPGQQGGEE